MMLEELRKVIPSFLTRVDRADRGIAWSAYLAETRTDTAALVARLFPADEPEPRPSVVLTDFDPEGEDKLLAAVCYPHTHAARGPDPRPGAAPRRRRAGRAAHRVRRRPSRTAVTGPGRAFERVDYRFDVLADYGAFRDLQRHRMLTIEWQRLGPRHGYDVPPEIADAGLTDTCPRRDGAIRSALYDAMALDFPEQASYAVALAYRVRFVMQMNAREAMHVIELRTAPQGHPTYRAVCQEMHRAIDEQAGHHAIAAAMRHVDHGEYALERLEAERAAEVRRRVTLEFTRARLARNFFPHALTCDVARRCRSAALSLRLDTSAAIRAYLHPSVAPSPTSALPR